MLIWLLLLVSMSGLCAGLVLGLMLFGSWVILLSSEWLLSWTSLLQPLADVPAPGLLSVINPEVMITLGGYAVHPMLLAIHAAAHGMDTDVFIVWVLFSLVSMSLVLAFLLAVTPALLLMEIVAKGWQARRGDLSGSLVNSVALFGVSLFIIGVSYDFMITIIGSLTTVLDYLIVPAMFLIVFGMIGLTHSLVNRVLGVSPEGMPA